MKKIFLVSAFICFTSILCFSQDRSFEFLDACWNGNLEKVDSLISDSVDVNTMTYEDVSGLMYASEQGHLDVVKLLVESGAWLDERSMFGVSALISSVKAGHLDVAEYLIVSGANINLSDYDGVTPLIYAASSGLFYITEMLAYYGADINQKTSEGVTALMAASWYGYNELIGLLLDLGANIEDKDKLGLTALSYAILSEKAETVSYLISYGANIEYQTYKGYTPLSTTVIKNSKEIAELLIVNDVKINTDIKQDRHAVVIAKVLKNRPMELLLTKEGARIGEIVMGPPMLSLFSWIGADEPILGGMLGIQELKYGIEVHAGFAGRLGSKFIQQRVSSNRINQYRESRYYTYLGVQKDFPIFSYRKWSIDCLAGLRLWYSDGKYTGTLVNAPQVVKLRPSLSGSLNYSSFFLRVGYDRIPLGYVNIPIQKISLSLGWNIIPSSIIKLKRYKLPF